MSAISNFTESPWRLLMRLTTCSMVVDRLTVDKRALAPSTWLIASIIRGSHRLFCTTR